MINFKDFSYFCRLQLATGDYDAHIPFINGLRVKAGLSAEESVWYGFLYMGYYSEGSAWAAFQTRGVRKRDVPPPPHLPITTQRRNLYGGRVVRHFADLYKIRPRLTDWLRPCETWRDLLDLLGGVYGNGRWASYTTGELMTHLAGLGVQPSTYEVVGSSGPRKGLAALGLEPSEESAAAVMAALRGAGVAVPAASVLESLLCDWSGMTRGTFYAGRNIDRQQGRVLAVENLLGVELSTLWVVRRRVFPPETLGELNGWSGIDKSRLGAYRDRGVVLAPAEGRRGTSSNCQRRG